MGKNKKLSKAGKPHRKLNGNGVKFRFLKNFSITTVLAQFVLFLAQQQAFNFRPEWKYKAYDYVFGLEDHVYTWLNGPYDNLELGNPGGDIDVIIERRGYSFGYSEKYEQALWVSYKLTADEIQKTKAQRKNDFREDLRIASGSATPEDYHSSGYDRGHLAPAADMKWSDKAMSESFFMSNMTPQIPEVNRGIWLETEEMARKLALREDEVYIVSGPVFYSGKKIKTIGQNKVAVPHACYKVIYLPQSGKMVGFLVPNNKKKNELSKCICSVRKIEEYTGLRFFSKIPESVAESMKKESKIP